MHFDFNEVVVDLQKKNILPSGDFSYSGWEQQFSFVRKLVIGEKIFYFKILKPRKMHNNNDMIEKLEESKRDLAVKEKEDAWREMAQQVAHETRFWRFHTPSNLSDIL